VEAGGHLPDPDDEQHISDADHLLKNIPGFPGRAGLRESRTRNTMNTRSFQRRCRRRGKVLVLVALSLTALIGASSFALDGGLLVSERRHAQAVADAAAMAGAIDLFKNYQANGGLDSGGTASSSALAVAASNGYANDGVNSVVTVRLNPNNYLGGPNAGTQVPRGHIEVTAQYNQQRGFSAIWGSNRLPVSARAVACGMWYKPDYGILTLDPTASPATNANGNGIVTVDGGAMITDSNSSGGLRVTGGGSMIATNFNGSGSSYIGSNFSTTPTTSVPPTPDPLRYLPEPSIPGPGSITKSGNTYTISPGLFGRTGGINSNPPKLPNFNSGDVVTFQPGIYYLQGGLTSTGATITGTGVMFFNAPTTSASSDGISISGGVVTLTPMTTGIYKGITFFQARNATQSMNISGGGSFNIDGTFYAANAQLQITGSSGTANIGSMYISRTLTLGGNGNINVNSRTGIKANQRLLMLVE
jgi:Flp pilus assembly protein TadG